MQEAARLYRLAADQRYPSAQYRLARFKFGKGVERDFGEAARLFRAAALQGHLQSQRSLGACYGIGKGVEENKLMAACFYRLADELGLEYAQGSLKSLKLSSVWI